MHLGVDEGTGEILAAVVTTNDIADCEVLPDLWEQIDSHQALHQPQMDSLELKRQNFFP